MLKIPLFAVAASAFFGCLALPLAAQELGPDDWGLTCEAQGCIVLKPVMNDDGQRLMSLTFAVPTNGASVRMAVLTPLGTALGAGLQISYGTVSKTFAFTTCMPDGCAVMVDLTQDELSNMLVQPSIEFSFKAVTRAEPYVATLPLQGLDEAIDMAMKGGPQ
jgi:invasion protein IalB